jgi:hypothetical protein
VTKVCYNSPSAHTRRAAAGAAAEEGQRIMGKGKAHGRGVAKRLLGPHRQQTERSFAQGRRSNLPTVDGGFCPDPDLVQRSVLSCLENI